jgi:uncharacterized protein involved in outer membrane biogenesis
MAKKRKPIGRIIGVILIIGLVGLRIYLPTFVREEIVKTIRRIPGYTGDIQEVTLALWRGAYSIMGLHVEKLDHAVPIPFVKISKINFSIAWKPLLRGNLSGKVELDRPEINFVSSKNKENRQLSLDKDFQQPFMKLFPLRIARFGVKDGQVHFRNYDDNPPVDVYLQHIFILATNLTNSQRLSRTLKATIDAQAVAMSTSPVTLHAVLDPLDPKPTFEFAFKLENLALSQLNSFFQHYLAVEAKTGTLDFYMEGNADKGTFKGYAKPLLENLDLVKMKADASIGEAVKAVVVKFVSYALKNHAKDRLATRIEINGTLDKPAPNLWSAVCSFFHNWIIKALSKGFEGVPA